MVLAENISPPSLEELLARRGIHKSKQFGDYQDYIELRQREGVRPKLMANNRVLVNDMRLALGRTMSTQRFWKREDKKP